MDLVAFGAVITGIAGLGGLVLAALRYRREDAGAVVAQMSEILAGMRALYDEATTALDRCRRERLAAEGLAAEHREKWEQAEQSLAKARRQLGELAEELDGEG
jgi:uncharacterized protein (DUF3084 family)